MDANHASADNIAAEETKEEAFIPLDVDDADIFESFMQPASDASEAAASVEGEEPSDEQAVTAEDLIDLIEDDVPEGLSMLVEVDEVEGQSYIVDHDEPIIEIRLTEVRTYLSGRSKKKLIVDFRNLRRQPLMMLTLMMISTSPSQFSPVILPRKMRTQNAHSLSKSPLRREMRPT